MERDCDIVTRILDCGTAVCSNVAAVAINAAASTPPPGQTNTAGIPDVPDAQEGQAPKTPAVTAPVRRSRRLAAAAAASTEPGTSTIGSPSSSVRARPASATARRTSSLSFATAVPSPDAASAQGEPSTPAMMAFRSMADLETAVAHLRARDPRLVPLIETHGLPRSLLPGSSTDGDAQMQAAVTPATLPKVSPAAPDVDTQIEAQEARDIPRLSSCLPQALEVVAAGEDGVWRNSGLRRSMFAALARSVVYQQLATNAATAIWGRVLVVCQATSGDHLTPDHVLKAPQEQLRAAGLSGRKVEYLVGLAEAFASRTGWDEQLSACSDVSSLISELTPLRGVGTWTVHMLAMFHLGLPDVLPTGDLGVRRGLQLLHGLAQLPEPAQVEALTEAWRPYRSAGSWYMWRIPPPPRTRGGQKAKKGRAAVGSDTDERVPSKAKAKRGRGTG